MLQFNRSFIRSFCSNKHFRNIKIQVRLLILFLLVSLIPILLIGIFSYHESSKAIKSKISTYSVQIMDQIAENIQRELITLENYSIDIVFSDLIQRNLIQYDDLTEWEKVDFQNKLHVQLVKKFSFNHDISDVLVYRLNNDKINGYGDTGIKFNLKKKFFKSFSSLVYNEGGMPVWMPVGEESQGNDLWLANAKKYDRTEGILLSRAIRYLDDGRIIGLFVMRINEKFFEKIYSDTDIGEGADIFVVNSQGMVVSNRNEQKKITDYISRDLIELVNKSFKSSQYVFKYRLKNNNYMVAISYIENADWYVVSMIPYSYLNSEVNKMMRSNLILLIFVGMIVTVVSYIFARSISQPLKKLVHAMNEAQKGNLSISIKDQSKDEIGEATRNFNNMLDEINHLIQDVKEQETQKRKAELKTLQAQINPHFLSNTLNTVKWLANIQGVQNIESIITSLIQLLHTSMGKGKDVITIREEIEYVKSFINIQEYRYFNKFEVNFDIDEEIVECKIPKLLLQPIVENALIHGIEPMKGRGMIIIKGFAYENKITIRVTDNGVGISESRMNELVNRDLIKNKANSNFSGIGIGNIEERIHMYFGKQYGLNIDSVPGLFTTAEITIPFIKGE